MRQLHGRLHARQRRLHEHRPAARRWPRRSPAAATRRGRDDGRQARLPLAPAPGDGRPRDVLHHRPASPPLAERGITLSSSQVYRLVVERPERLSLKILMALLDILDCTMDDLIEPVAAAGPARRTGKAAAGGAADAAGSAPCDRSERGSPARRSDRCPAPAPATGRRPARPDGAAGARAQRWKRSSGHWSRRRRATTGGAASQPP